MFGWKVWLHFDTLHLDLARKSAETRNSRNEDKKVTQEKGTSRLVRQFMLETMDLETWLPGNVMEIQGSILHTTLLRDGRGICQHAQLRSHHQTGMVTRRTKCTLIRIFLVFLLVVWVCLWTWEEDYRTVVIVVASCYLSYVIQWMLVQAEVQMDYLLGAPCTTGFIVLCVWYIGHCACITSSVSWVSIIGFIHSVNEWCA